MHAFALCLLLTGATAPAGASSAFSDLTPLPEAKLASLRGGFMLPNGVEISLGIETAVLINGEYAAHAIWAEGNMLQPYPGVDREGLHISPLDPLAAGGHHGMGWLVQNRLDGQVIQHVSELHLRLDGVQGLTDPDLSRMVEAQSVFQVLR